MDNNLLDLSKALDTSTTNGNNVLDPVLLSKIISDQVRRLPVLRNMIKRQAWGTNIYTWDLVADHGVAQVAADNATLSFADAKFSQGQAKMSYFYHLAMITNPAILAAQELVDLVSLRVGGAVKQVMRLENSVLFNGDAGNAQNAGLKAALIASPTYNVIGDGATLSRSALAAMDIALRGEGYEPGVFVVSPGVYNIISQAAFNQVRFLGIADQAQVGYALTNNTILFNGIPVVMDKYAEKATAITGETMTTTGDTTVFKFAHANVYRSAGQDFAGTTWNAPVIKVSGATKTAGTDYKFQPDGSIKFVAGAPSATPTADYTFGADNVYLLSLDPQDLVIAEQMGINVEQDLAKPVQQDAIPLRVKEYSVLAVRNPLAHVLASNVVLPASVANF
jgi:hypothetical protein